MEPTDTALLDQWVSNRDAGAFAELVARHAAMVYGTCRRIITDPAAAEDVTQECFLKLSQRKGSSSRSLAGWLHRMATHRSIDYVRAIKRRRTREAVFQVVRSTNTDPAWDEIEHCIDAAVAELPDDLRVPVLLHFFEGQTHAAIADTLGMTRSGVTRRIQKGTEQIRRALEHRGIRTLAVGVLAGLLTQHVSEAAAPPALLARLGKYALAGKSGGVSVSLESGSKELKFFQGGTLPMRFLAVCVVSLFVVTAGILLNRSMDDEGVVPAEMVAQAPETEVAPSPPVATETSEVTQATESEDESMDTPPAGASLRCVDQDGRPVVGAEVYFTHIVNDAPTMVRTFGKNSSRATDIGPVSADADGRVALPVLDESEDPERELLFAYARTPGEKVGAWRRAESGQSSELIMVDGTAIEGRVEVPEGFIPADATVQVLTLAVLDGKSRYGTPFPASHDGEVRWSELFSTRPDGSGRFLFHDLPKSGRIYLAANAPGLAETQFMSFDPANAGTVKLDMPPEGIIEGTVRFSDTGKPATGYSVYARTRSAGGVAHPHATVVERDASFRIHGLPTGEYCVVVAPMTWPRQYVAAVESKVEVEAGLTTGGLELWLEKGTVFSGTVKDSDTGDPIAGVLVVALNPGMGGESIGSYTTEKDGRYEIRLPTGKSMFYIAAVPDGYVYPKDQARRYVDVFGDETEVADVGFQLARREGPDLREAIARIKGRVLDTQGKPVAEALVTEEWEYKDGEDDRMVGGVSLGHADDDGYFEVQIRAYGRHRITVGKLGYSAAKGEWFTISPDGEKVLPDLTIYPAAGWIEGVVLDPDGYPIADARVQVSSRQSFPTALYVRTDRDGRFRVEHLVDEEIHIFIKRTGFEQGFFEVQPRAEYEFTLTLASEEGPANSEQPE